MIKLKVSESEKFKDNGQWFKDYMDAVIPGLFPESEDYKAMLTAYKVVNNDLSDFKDLLKQFCNPLADTVDMVEEEILPYPELHNAVNVLKGEVVQRRDQLHLMLLSANAIKSKNQKMFEAIKLSVDEKLGLELQKQEMQMQGMDEKQMDEFIKQLRTQLEPEDLAQKNWLSEIEIFYNKSLDFCTYDQNLLDKKADTMSDLAIADRLFIYSGWKHGRPTIEVRNPLYVVWDKSPNEKYIHKSSWIAYQKPIQLVDAIEAYNLKDEDIEKLSVTFGSGLDKRHSLGKDGKMVFDHTKQDLLINQTQGNTNKDIGLSQTDGQITNPNLVWETHFELKAFKELIFLSYTDSYGEPITSVLDSSFKIPKTAKKIEFTNRYDIETEKYVWEDQGIQFEAEKIWIPRRYEIVRLGQEVYPVFREVPYQNTNIERPFETFHLSTFGAVVNNRNAKSVSPVQRALAPYLQLLYIKYVTNKELSKYQGAIQSIDIDQIPDSLGQDIDGKPVRDKLSAYLTTLRKTNKDIFSGSQVSNGALPPTTRSPGSQGYLIGTAIELMNLHQLSELVKQEVALAMGLSPQRLASFQQGSNVTDNQQAVQQSYAITEPYFFIHSLIWKDALNDWLCNWRSYCENQMKLQNVSELSFQYWLPGNIQEVLQVFPQSLEHTDIGLFLSASSSFERYAEVMLQNAQAFAQNQGQGITAVSQIIKDIMSKASPEEIHKRIQIEEAKVFERQQQLQQQTNDGQKQLLQMQDEAAIKAFEREKELVVLKEEERRKTVVAQAAISASGFSEDKDLDDDGVPDIIEIMDHSLKKEKLNLDVKKHQDTMEIKREELKIKNKMANKKPAGSK